MSENTTEPAEGLDELHQKATAEVSRTISAINEVETRIADKTGATGKELTVLTDDYLTDKAVFAAQAGATDAEDAVDTALIEGALELTHQRPPNNNDPIKQLHDAGRDSDIIEGVSRLHREEATLPDGESAAMVVAKHLDQVEVLERSKPGYNNHNYFDPSKLEERSESIDTVLKQAHETDAKMAEIPVWGAIAVPVEYGKVGVISTEGLNGCHTTILAGRNEGGDGMVAMTHFPPEIGSERYAHAVREHMTKFEQAGVKLNTVVIFVDEKRFPKETALLKELFPSASFTEASYNSRDQTKKGPDYGKCVAILDNREARVQLSILTDTGDHKISVT